MSAFSVENPHDGKMFENYTRFEWGVKVGVVTIFMLRLFVPHEFDMDLIFFDFSVLDDFFYCFTVSNRPQWSPLYHMNFL